MRRCGRILLVWSFLHALAAAGAPRTAPPPARVVALTASDGTLLKATLFSAGRPGPGVLLLHQSNRDRRSWAPVARALAAAGIHALTLDLRGFGESDGPRYVTLGRQEIGRARAPWPDDIELAWRFLASRPEVDARRIGLGGAGVDGVDGSVQTARRHPGEVRSLALLSGETPLPGLRFLAASPDLPALCVVADDDEYPPTVEAMELLFQAVASPAKKLIHYAGKKAPWVWFEPFDVGKVPATGGHGTDLFKGHPELPAAIVDWFVTTLVTSPGRAPPDTLGSWAALRELESPVGVARVREQLETARRRDPVAQLFPEVAVGILGNDHLRANEADAAVETFELNVLAYPDSADAHSDLANGYLASGRPDLALPQARAALALLDSHAAPASSWSDTEARRAVIRDDAERALEKASRAPAGAPQTDAGSRGPAVPTTLAAAVDKEISRVEEQVLAAAEAMPEDRFDFSPERLRIPGSAYQGVRTFAVQIRHIAASNYFIWSPLTGERLPEGLKDGEGPAELQSRAEILAFLRRSFDLGHRAAATLTPDNMLQPAGSSTRLQRAMFAVAHAFDHYGQMVEYLRMNGIIPPATRARSH
jgi:dienelactone hydrolase/tetratricopeptide (TPR) repeat protein